MKFYKPGQKVPEKLTLALAEALADVPEHLREEFLAELLRASKEMVSFFEAYDTYLVSEEVLDQLPETIRHYQILQPIGEGSMGRVYEGWDPHGKRRVAIKTLAASLFQSQMGRDKLERRFSREASIVGRLNHPHIVTLIDYFYDQQPYLILEFVPGETLANRLERTGTIPITTIAKWVIQICQALAHAHQSQIIHRDLKPSNILINNQDDIKLADFGISKFVGEETLTHTGFLGTPIFAAPEQVTGLGLSASTDLFALAIILHLLLTGRHPFRGENVEQTLYNLANKPAKLATLKPESSIQQDRFEQFFTQALHKQSDKRFPNAHAFQQAFCNQCMKGASNL